MNDSLSIYRRIYTLKSKEGEIRERERGNTNTQTNVNINRPKRRVEEMERGSGKTMTAQYVDYVITNASKHSDAKGFQFHHVCGCYNFKLFH